MKALIVDAGNTRTIAAIWSGNDALPDLSGNPVPLDVIGTWNRGDDPGRSVLKAAGDRPVVMVSVVPAETARWQALVPGLTVVDSLLPLPFETAVEDLAAVGPDRLANVAAARAAGLDDALIVDAGTATTFDLLSDGCFLGGMIAPGMAFAAQRLGEEAARLGPVPFEPVDWTVGSGTVAAMKAGAWHTGTGGVQAVIAGILGEYGRMPVILTGGLEHFLAWEGAHHDPYWTLRGAACLGLPTSAD
jgi:type III pantothenate kinase